MALNVNINVGDFIPYLVDSIKQLFGKDSFTKSVQERFQKQVGLSIEISSKVQCVGMWEPIPISQIYQPTRLKPSPFSNDESIKELTIWNLLKKNRSCIILAGPGNGKTVLMHWLFTRLLNKEEYLPLLFTLRWPNAINDLERFIRDLTRGQEAIYREAGSRYTRVKKSKKKVILLVDGYDEVSLSKRKEISKLLIEFESLEVGISFLTCRNNYDIYDLNFNYYWISSFNDQDSLEFCKSFFKIYKVEGKPLELLNELKRKGFSSFTQHPLMLTLVCILHSTPLQSLPKSSLGLTRRAIDLLTLRWDDSKGISRESRIPLDGEERIQCLMRIASSLRGLTGTYEEVLSATRLQLECQQIQGVDSRRLLSELAQWYGLLVPVTNERWSFVHRTIHDFLAARFLIESGKFFVQSMSRWDTRSAYAMSMIPDATLFLSKALLAECEMHVLTQCLINHASFNPNEIANSISIYLSKITLKHYQKECKRMIVHLPVCKDFFQDTSIAFLEALILVAINKSTPHVVSDILLSYSLYEFYSRKKQISKSLFNQINLFLNFPKFEFIILKGNKSINYSLDEIKH